jgi:hypothetical protein
MFYNNTFVGNWEDLIYGDYTEATTLQELKSMIESLTSQLEAFHTHKAPAELMQPYQQRLVELVKYFISVGGNLAEDSTRDINKAKGKNGNSRKTIN